MGLILQRLQVLHDAPAFDTALLEVMIEHLAHQPLRLGGGRRIRIPLLG
jgi:hypothetical protein